MTGENSMFTKSDCKIHVLIPAYNVEPYIKKCLDSLVGQTLKEIKITVLDDGSTDRTGIIIDEYAKKYKNITALHQENSGLTKARSRLMAIAQGEYIGWVDADDFAEKTMYEKLYERAVQEKADMTFCDYSFYPKEIPTKRKWFRPYEGKVDWFFLTQNSQHWNKIVKLELIERYELSKWNDYCGEISYMLMLLVAKRIASVNEALYNYRVGQVSMSNNFHDVKLYVENIEKTIRFREVIRTIGLNEEWGCFFDSSISIAYIQAMIVAAYNNKKAIYINCKNKSKEMNMNQNKYIKLRMDSVYGKLKSWVLRKLVPAGYLPACALAKIALK